MDNCIFCKIIKGEIPAEKVWEDESYLAFLTIRPINPGHTLLIPKAHVSYLFDMEDQLLGGLFIAAKPLVRALMKAFNPVTGKVGVMVAGLEVDHTHVHLIPLNSEVDLNLSRAKSGVPIEQLQKDTERIKAAL